MENESDNSHEETGHGVTEETSLSQNGKLPVKRAGNRVGASSVESGNEANVPTTKLRKRGGVMRNNGAFAPVQASVEADMSHEHGTGHADGVRDGRTGYGDGREVYRASATWPRWLCVFGLLFAGIGVVLFVRARDEARQEFKTVEISTRFVDHQAVAPGGDSHYNQALSAEQQAAIMTPVRSAEDQHIGPLTEHAQAAKQVLEQYVASETQKDMLNYVAHANEVAAKMAHWFATIPKRDPLPKTILNQSKVGDILYLTFAMQDDSVRRAVFVYNADKRQWQLDWESWVGYSPNLLVDLKQQRPGKPVPVRVTLQHAHVYNEPFGESDSPSNYKGTLYKSYQLGFPSGDFLYAYVDKYSPLAVQLSKLLQAGPAQVHLMIHYPEDVENCQDVIIDRVVFADWISTATHEKMKAKP